MKVSLRKFLEIVGNSLIETYLCRVYVEIEEEIFEGYVDTANKCVNSCLTHINQLNEYLDYEIYGFDQRTEYGEVTEQMLWLRKM